MKRFLIVLVSVLACGVGPVAAQEEGRPDHVWGGAEYLHWWFKDAPVPVPLVTTGPIVGNLQPVFAQPGHQVVIGGEYRDTGEHPGGRFTFGAWLGREKGLGFEGTYFFLATRSPQLGVSSSGAPGSPFLALPFIDARTGTESSTRIALPGGFAGTAILSTASRLEGCEATGICDLGNLDMVGPDFRLELLGGFRYLHLSERLSLDTSSPTVIGPTDVFRTHDEFHTRNRFYGGQVGVRGEFCNGGPLVLQAAGKIALGTMNEAVSTGGTLATNDFNGLGAPQVFPGGYLTQPTNLGRVSQNRFAYIPEVNLNLIWRMGDLLALKVGYSFLYITDVVRPGDQIDRVVNPTQAPAITGNPAQILVGPSRPTAQFHPSDFWAHGANAGIEIRY